jgi:DNA polymerase-1
MKDFNFQQVPKKGPSKKLIVSRFESGQILQVDLSQAELRIAAYLSNDHEFAAALMRGDMHRENAARAFGVEEAEVTDDQRFQAKAVIFRTIYGGRPITDGQKRVYAYAERAFPDLFKWMKRMQNSSITNKSVTDPYGKTRNLNAVFDYRGKWAVGRAGINSPVQGVASHTALEITLYAWNSARYALSKVLFGVHDSTIADVHPDETEFMINVFKQSFLNLACTPIGKFELFSTLPLTGDLQIGVNWAALKTAPVIKCSSKGA